MESQLGQMMNAYCTGYEALTDGLTVQQMETISAERINSFMRDVGNSMLLLNQLPSTLGVQEPPTSPLNSKLGVLAFLEFCHKLTQQKLTGLNW